MSKTRSRTQPRVPIRVPARPQATPPGHVVYPIDNARTRASLLAYGPEECAEIDLLDVQAIAQVAQSASVRWVDVEGVGDGEILRQLGTLFGWHPLVLEDTVHQHQRPKAEGYGDYGYITIHMPTGSEGLPFEQLSLFFGTGYVVTVQGDYPGDCLEPLRERIRNKRGRVRDAQGDYLAYAIVDVVVDSYFPIAERLNARLEVLEERLVRQQSDAEFVEIHSIRNDLHTLWRTVAATAEALHLLARGETGPVSATTQVYLRDCQDHCKQLLDVIAACRELSASLMELHHAAVSNRVNEGMRILTLTATIFMPMSFIAGLYGMNFDRDASPFNMPELGFRYGYPLALGIMLSTGGLLLWFFTKRGWFAGSGSGSNVKSAPNGAERPSERAPRGRG